MHAVEVSRTVAAPPGRVRHNLGPADLLEYEGTFTVRDVSGGDGEWEVIADAGGAITAVFEVERTETGYVYEQAGTEGPFESMRTEVDLAEANGGTRVTMRSTVSLGLPLSGVTDRLAGWKRRRELERALDALADALDA